MAYIGREPQIGNYQVCDAISVVNGQAAYTMQVSSVNVIPESVNHMIVSLNGVIQNPGSSYTISSSTITFSSNLATGDSIDFIYLLGNVLDLGTPSDSTVTSAKLSGNLVTPGTLDVNGQELILDADADTSITADTDDQIDIKVAGADDFRITANTFTALSGSGIVIPDSGLTLGSTAVTSTAAELNLLDGVSGLVQADLTKLAAVDSTAAELNIVDGGTSATSTTLVDADRFVVNDNGTMVQVAASDLKTYIGGGDNTPSFGATLSADQNNLSSGTFTLAAFNTEVWDTDNAYTNTSSNYKFTVPSGEGGKYFITAHLMFRADGTYQAKVLRLNKNGNFLVEQEHHFDSNYIRHDYSNTVSITTVQNLSADDYIQVYGKASGQTWDLKAEGGYFSMHKLIGV